MARFRHTLYLPGNDVTDLEKRIEGNPTGNVGQEIFPAQDYTFETGFQILVQVVFRQGNEVDLCAYLHDQSGDVVQEMHLIDGGIDQDYIFEDEQDTYTLTIARGFLTRLTNAQAAAYVENGGVRCPFCDASDIHGRNVEINEGQATQEVSCCACDGAWTDVYMLSQITELVPPTMDEDH